MPNISYIKPKFLTLSVLYWLLLFIVMPVYSDDVVFEEHPVKKDNAVYKEEFDIILKQLDKATERIEALEEKQTIQKGPLSPEETVESLQEDLDELVEILDEVEKKSIVDRMELRGELRTRFDWYSFQGHDTIPFTSTYDGPKKSEHIAALPTNRFRLNLRTKIGSWLHFHSRLSMTHIWSDDDYPVYPERNLINAARIPSDISLKVERAYADLFFSLNENYPMALTFGRLPTTDGLPTNLRDDTARKSTYPGIAYDVETDGLGLSIDISHLTGLKDAAYRLVYVRRCEDNERYTFGKIFSGKKGVYRVDEKGVPNLEIYISQFETHIPGLFQNTLFLFNLVYFPDIPPMDMRFSDDLYPFYYDSTGFLFVDKPDSIGSIWKATVYLESKEVFNMPMDAFFGASYVKSDADGALKFMINPTAVSLDGPPVEARYASTIYASLQADDPDLYEVLGLEQLSHTPPAIGLVNKDGTSDRESYAIQIGGRYQLSLPKLNNPKIGIEYNYGSQYWLGFCHASEDPLHKSGNRGTTWDLYYIQPINRYFWLRLGYTDLEKEYDDGVSFYYGDPNAVDHRIRNMYFLLDARF